MGFKDRLGVQFYPSVHINKCLVILCQRKGPQKAEDAKKNVQKMAYYVTSRSCGSREELFLREKKAAGRIPKREDSFNTRSHTRLL